MTSEPDIRESGPADVAGIESLYPAAFPDEDLLPVVRSLLGDPAVAMSLVAIVDQQVAGHVIFTTCGIDDDSNNASLLGPLAVTPARQRQGIGGRLVRAGLERLEKTVTEFVFVLGDPAYYGRFGFEPDRNVEPPYPLPPEWDTAWQSLELGPHRELRTGKLSVPSQWRQPALWAP